MTPWPATVRRLVYFGTPQLAVAPLRALSDAGFEVTLAVTGPDRRRSRRGTSEPSPVGRAATELGVPVTHDPADAAAAAGAVDGAVVVAYGRLIGSDVLDVLSAVNVHFSLLPRWRGAAPMERAILAADEVTGISLMALTETLDAGPLYAQATTPIGPDETLAELRDRLVALSCPLLVELLRAGPRDPVAQEGEVTWADKIGDDDLHLDWEHPAVELHRRVRLGRAWTTLAGERLRILRAGVVPTHSGSPGLLDGLVVGTTAGGLRLDEVQAAGRRALPAGEWHRGARLAVPCRLGT
ncbi:MAG: methionyl-tRNA formyltransferase [Acidimicrobiia bacterium]|nr:methionyl-tRNA formyltransferase [Acidimicrobiia bacterium]MYC45137.1 methionyl-tRNA formyltransferase [Acidimicrobiia bacterium]MYI21068.1 methionyl-tRNA formyltransferase [Acidimicrobiia bacterium]